MQHCLELGLMVGLDVQGTSETTVICRAGSRVHDQRDTQIDVSDVQNYKKLGNLNTCGLVKLSCDAE